MKKNNILLRIFIVVMISGTTMLSAHAEDKIELKLRLEKGQSYRTKIIKDMRTQYEGQGQQQNMTTRMETKNIYTVEDVQTDGAAVVGFIYDALFFQHEYPGGKSEYDSSNPSSSVGQGMSIFDAVVGQSLTATISPDGHIKEIKRLTDFLNHIQNKINESSDVQAKAYIESSFKKYYSEETIRENMENLFNIYPDRPVCIGDTWQKRTKIRQEIPVIADTIYTLKERKGGIAIIDVFSMLQPDKEAEPTEMGPMKFQYNMSGSATGIIEMQESTGWPIRSNQKLRLSGTVTIQSPRMQQPMSAPMSLSGTITLEPF